MKSRTLPTHFIRLAFNKLMRRLRHAELRRAGARIGAGVQTYALFFEGDPTALDIEDKARIMPGAMLTAGGAAHSLRIGQHAYLNSFALIDSRARIEIGYGTIIGPGCYISDYDHSLAFNADGHRIDEGETAPVMIGENIWIGANVTILKGVTIGDRTVVGAGAVVTKNLPPDSVAVGVPARVVRILGEGAVTSVGAASVTAESP